MPSTFLRAHWGSRKVSGSHLSPVLCQLEDWPSEYWSRIHNPGADLSQFLLRPASFERAGATIDQVSQLLSVLSCQQVDHHEPWTWVAAKVLHVSPQDDPKWPMDRQSKDRQSFAGRCTIGVPGTKFRDGSSSMLLWRPVEVSNLHRWSISAEVVRAGPRTTAYAYAEADFRDAHRSGPNDAGRPCQRWQWWDTDNILNHMSEPLKGAKASAIGSPDWRVVC